MTDARTPHNFLIHLRNHSPWLARLFDGARAISYVNFVLTVKMDLSVWPGIEVGADTELIGEWVRVFFGSEAAFAVEDAPRNAEKLPLAVEASKYWNHVAFLSMTGDGGVAAFAVRKTLYAAKFATGSATPEDFEQAALLFWKGDPEREPSQNLVDTLPLVADALASIARIEQSYAQIVMAFPGHELADMIEARLYAVRDWGTPETPPAIMQKYLGRIHYVDGRYPPVGLKFVRDFRQD